MPKLTQTNVAATAVDLHTHEPAFSARGGNLQQETFAIRVAARLGKLLAQGWRELSHTTEDSTAAP